MSNVFKIPESLGHKYRGAGHAVAASLDGELIDFVYLRDALPDFSSDDVLSALGDERLGPTIRGLQVLGEVHAGMCSAWEFVVL